MSENELMTINSAVQVLIDELIEEFSLENPRVFISEGSSPGDNYFGSISKVLITGKENKNGAINATKLDLIVKSAPKNESLRKYLPVRRAYEREIYIYDKVLPEFTKLQQERGVSNQFNSFAKYYKSTMSNLNESIIMQNVKVLGFELGNRHKPLNYDETLLVLKEYGRFHALSFALRDQKPEIFQQLFDNTQEVSLNGYQTPEVLKDMQNDCEHALKSLNPVQDEIAYNRFKKFKENMAGILKEVLRSESAGKYAVIGHGDSWINNILFKYKVWKKPSEVCFVDWQLARVGSPILDVSCFIFASTDKNLRDNCYDMLMKEYYESFSSFLKELGSDPEKLLPNVVFQEHLKKFSVFGLYMAVGLLRLLNKETLDSNNFSNHNIRNGCVGQSEVRNDQYSERIRDVILDFIKFNYDC